MGPAPRLTLDLGRAVESAITGDDALESMVARAQDTVEETLETIQEGVELSDPIAFATEQPLRRSHRVMSKAESLTRRAEEVKAAAAEVMASW